VLLLAAIKKLIGDAVAIRTSTILEKLNPDENLPFSECRKGESSNAHGLARLLKPFVIRPQTLRVDGGLAKGYRREQFADAWMRYCPDTGPEADAEDAHSSHADRVSDCAPLLRNNPGNDGGFQRYGALFDERSEIASVTRGSPVDAGDVTELRSETANTGTHGTKRRSGAAFGERQRRS